MSNEVRTRREFLEFIGRGTLVVSSLPLLNACETVSKAVTPEPFKALSPTKSDSLSLVNGLKYDIIARWGDPLRADLKFGTNNDYLVFFSANEQGTDGILWVNHEYLAPALVSGRVKGKAPTKAQAIEEMKTVGGSLIRIRKSPEGQWSLVQGDKYNRRLDAFTEIPFAGGVAVEGKTTAMGTMGNCAGGFTPWGTVLTAEENFQLFYGRSVFEDGKKKHIGSQYGWEKHFDNPPEHYGWIVEVDPMTGSAKKHTSIGRYAQECATILPLEDGRVVAYSGDDAENECLYKFIADKPGSLDTGTLYVADIGAGKWISLKYEDQPILQKHFKNQVEVLVRCREAAKLVGGTPLDRPEDIEIDPVTGAVLVTVTNNKPKGNFYGSILKIEEKGGKGDSLEFKASTFISGGPDTGFACPDNMAFDRAGNLWLTCDISEEALGKGPYSSFVSNGLFYIPMSGPHSGKVFQVASGPVDSELSGPFFSPDGETLFLSVQHPGENSKSRNELTSNWPEGNGAIPRSSVVAITGPLLKNLQSGTKVDPIFDVPLLKL
ncbi:MAG TPA: alkaline phosphatase PhoX [Bdellovibrionales bacterium]|nr:alkaline phosphatase PhoX [Bdellovibrionales bacterium]